MDGLGLAKTRVRGTIFFMKRFADLSLFITLMAGYGTFCLGAEPTVHIHQLDPKIDAVQLNQPGVKVHLADPEDSSWVPPSSVEREHWFQEAELAKEVQSWDELERDVLIIKSRTLPLARLVQSYPSLSKAKLQKLQKRAKELGTQ